METQDLRCDVVKTEDPTAGRVATVTCHGRLVAGTSEVLKETVKPLIAEGGKIIVDVGGVQFVDSMGLGALVGLKVSAIGAGYCTLQFENLSKKVQELVSITHLTDLFKS
jgi:anti-sigma B factor antagonist